LLGRARNEIIENYECDVISTIGLAFSVIEKKPNEEKNWKHPEFDEYFTDDTIQSNDNNNKKKTKNVKKQTKNKDNNNNNNNNDNKFSPPYIHRKDRPVDITLWLCKNDYPLNNENIANILECISIASEDMRRLSEVFQIQFPKGFPIKLDIPILIGITASATFCNFQWIDIQNQPEYDDSLFQVPPDYRLI